VRDSSDLLIAYEEARNALANVRAELQRVKTQLLDLDVAVVKFREVEVDC
jgi:hypothetical protein